MNVEQLEQVVDLSFPELLDAHESVKLQLGNLSQALWLVEKRIVEIMDAQGARIMRVGDRGVRLSRPVTYDAGILAGLREITDPLDLVGVYTAEHDEVKHVPEKWNMAKGRKLLNLGNDHRAIIDDAKIFGNPKVEMYAIDERSTR